MKEKILVGLFALFCAAAISCANWQALSTDTKAQLICGTSTRMLSPECARLDADKQGYCFDAFKVFEVGCTEIVKAVDKGDGDGDGDSGTKSGPDLAKICPYIIEEAPKLCDKLFKKANDLGSCNRAVVAAHTVCVIGTAKPVTTAL